MFAFRAGLWLGLVEVLLVLSTGRTFFVSRLDQGRYALLALALWPMLLGGLGAVARRALRALDAERSEPGRFPQRLWRVVFALCAPACVWLAFGLSAGRRLRELPGRPALCVAFGLMAGMTLAALAVSLWRMPAGSRRARVAGLALLGVSGLALALDALVLKRLYPALHFALEVFAVAAALCGFARLETGREPRSMPSRVRLGALAGLLVVASVSLHSVATSPDARFAVLQSAPLSARVVRHLAPAQALDSAGSMVLRPESAEPATAPPQLALELDLRGRDVLLITIDALRADALRFAGGVGDTPSIDALAQESARFTRAYTPTPHTSYALSSLLTGKFIKPLLALSDGGADHPTLPELLRQFGYRTAAFYPPAIFFVDAERFAALQRKQFGFEYVKIMYATAAERVPQLHEYLRQAPADRPLFVWMHLFEPHEPYDPPAEFARGDSARERYRGELAAADAGVGALVAAFRAARPGATVILTADHGEEFGEHGGAFHGTTLFDEQVRIPLLWSSPGRVAARTIEAPVELIDVTTTLLSALRIPRDARMRGDDLGALLAGGAPDPGLRAFCSIDDERMLSDGRFKLICGDDVCRLHDLQADPRERRDASAEHPVQARTLRAELDALLASLPRVEALALNGGGAWPNALSRARLGDHSALPALVPLLADGRPTIRAAAARSLGELGEAPRARAALLWLRVHDPDRHVRAEAAIAALRYGAFEVRAQVGDLLGAPDVTLRAEQRLRAALALARHGGRSAGAILAEAALEVSLGEQERLAAVRALAAAGGPRALPALGALLADVRLRTAAADALAELQDPAAVEPLQQAIAQERYPAARHAEARALLALGARAPALAAIRRFLGMESSLPGGVQLLVDAGALRGSPQRGALLADVPGVRGGDWVCSDAGCQPRSGAVLRLLGPSGARQRRLALRLEVSAAEGGRLRIEGQTRELPPGSTELSVVAKPGTKNIPLEADAGTLLQAFAVVDVQDEIPPPPPEPW